MPQARILKLKVPYGEDPRNQGFYWPDSEQKRTEINSVKRNSPAAFEATYQGRPGAREGSIFLDSDLNAFFATTVDGVPFPVTDFQNGIMAPTVRAFCSRGHMVAQAWDTAFSTTLESAWTVGVTGLLVPCQSYHCQEDPALLGPCDFHYDVLILDIFRKRLDFAGLIPAMRGSHRLWAPTEIVIEKRASGIDAIAALKSSGLPIVETYPREGKRERAVNSVGLKGAGSVQGWCRQHRVLTPQNASWLAAWRAEMKDFSGDDDASSDQVDATVHLVQRAIILGSSMLTIPSDWQPERTGIPGYLDPAAILPNGPLSTDPRAVMLSLIGNLPDNVTDPYEGTCSHCIHLDKSRNNFCLLHKRNMLPLDSCELYADTPIPDMQSIVDSFRQN